MGLRRTWRRLLFGFRRPERAFVLSDGGWKRRYIVICMSYLRSDTCIFPTAVGEGDPADNLLYIDSKTRADGIET